MKTLDTSLVDELRPSVDSATSGAPKCFVLNDPRGFFQRHPSDDILIPFCEVAASGFRVAQAEKGIEEIRNVVAGADLVVLMHNDSTLLGFATFMFFPVHRAIYLQGVVIDPDAQGQSRASTIIKVPLEDTESYTRLAFVTQSPTMFCLARKLTSSMCPNPNNPIVPMVEQEIARELRNGKKNAHDPRTLIIRDIYDPCLYTAIPESRDTRVNEWFRESLEIVNGQSNHGFFFIGNI